MGQIARSLNDFVCACVICSGFSSCSLDWVWSFVGRIVFLFAIMRMFATDLRSCGMLATLMYAEADHLLFRLRLMHTATWEIY